jgi:hypothetical protein
MAAAIPAEREPEGDREGHRGDRGGHAGVEAEPQQGRDADHQQHHEQVLHRVGQGATGQHRRAGDRQRPEAVDDAALEVHGRPDAGVGGAEEHRLHQDPGDHEVDVAGPGHQDRAAPDEGEQQHEHDRLHRGEQQQPGDAQDAEQVALGHDLA